MLRQHGTHIPVEIHRLRNEAAAKKENKKETHHNKQGWAEYNPSPRFLLTPKTTFHQRPRISPQVALSLRNKERPALPKALDETLMDGPSPIILHLLLLPEAGKEGKSEAKAAGGTGVAGVRERNEFDFD